MRPYTYTVGLTAILLFCFSLHSYTQLTGTLTIPGNYATISNAVTALNTAGVGAGGVIFNVAANYTETITATISLNATGTASNPIVFRKDPATSGANPLITAYTGGTGTPATSVQDGIWRLSGSDYVTIDAIDVADHASNTSNPATMEYGYALYKASASNGCQYITIRNCVISLNTINNAAGVAPMVDGSTGIIVMNALPGAATAAITPAAGGTNSFNKFYHNTIRNCNTGIALTGYAAGSPYNLADSYNDVGGSDPSTGNTIINYGGAAAAANPAVAIRTAAQYNLNVSYNTINNNNGTGINHPNTLRGIYINAATSASSTITNNTVTVNGSGTTQHITGIENASGSTAAGNTVQISNNAVINSTYTTATTGGFYGINNSGAPAVLLMNKNTVSNNSSAAATTGFVYGILNTANATAVSIDSNTVANNTSGALTTGLFVGVYNTASAPAVSISNNTVAGNSTPAATGLYYAIYNSGTVTNSININANSIGTAVTPAVHFTAVNSGSQVLIYNTKGAATASLSVNNNNFYNVLYAQPGTGTNAYIINSAATNSQAINNNTFHNLNVNTAGNITFITNNVVVPATGTQNVNGNAISGTFTKAAGGTVTFFSSSSAASATGSVINNNNNNFSNVTVTGATVITGWLNADAGGSTKTIQNNTFSNWTGGTGTLVAMSVSITGAGNATTGNTISNISSGGAITAITTGAGNDNIFLNTINGLTTTGASAITGISISSGTTKNVYRNKIYDLQATTGGTVNGISISGTTSGVVTANLYNNLIGDLRAPATSSSDAIRGVSITSTRASSSINVSFNTVYLNAVSTATNFGTSGIYHAASATVTTAALTLRSNLVTNTSTPRGTGLTVAYRRSGTSLQNYGTASNNNLFYAGAPATNRLIFYDGTNADQTLLTYKTRVTTRDDQSVTEDLITNSKFLSTSGSSSSFLHLDPAKATLVESGGIDILTITVDFDAQLRQGAAGYTGSGSAPDIGADEFNGTRPVALSGIVQVGTGQTFTSLTNAGGLFAGVNSLGLSGNVVVKVTSDLAEDGSHALTLWAEQGAGNYTLTIQPDASALRTIAGNGSTGLIRLNGAKRLIIDGSNGTTSNYLTFRNTNTAGTTGTAFTFINGATNNTISYSNIEAYANATNGVVLFSSSTEAGGNSSNTISHCSINATVNSNTGNVAIYSSGTTGRENTANTISNNNIFNYRDRGLDIAATGSGAWVILRNSFYNGDVSGAVSFASGAALHGIRIQGGAGFSIRNNYIGGNAALASGTNAVYSSTAGPISFHGILITTSSATPVSEIKSNTIASVSVSSVPNSTTIISNTFVGIETAGSGINVGGSVAGDGNMIGSNTINGSVLVTTTTSNSGHRSAIRGITFQSTGGIFAGNQAGGIDIRNIGSAPGPSSFTAFFINSATPPSQIINNVSGSAGAGAASNSIRVLSTSTSTTTTITGIAIGSSVTSTVQVSGNTMQNVSYLSTASSGTITGISVAATGTAAITVTGNTINGNVNNATTGGFYGISNSASPATLTITSNTISGTVSTATTTGFLYGIYTAGAPSSITISSNIFSGNTTGALTTGGFIGVYNIATPATLNVNSNSFYGNATTSASGTFYSIYNSGAVTTTININSNSIGTSSAAAITFNAASSAIQYLIYNTGGAATAALSISNNNFYNIAYAVAGTGNNFYILNSATTLSQAINSNTFNNLNVNTSGSITFISDNVIVPATGSQNINNNSIAGTFTKRAGGTVTLFTSAAASAAGSVINNNNNNFSNITVTTSTVIAGWICSDAGSSTRTIQNNTFSNWTGGTGAITALTVNQTGVTNSTTGNVISSMSSAGAITGISTVAGNDNIYANLIHTLSTSGNVAVTGIAVSAGTTKNVYRNKIYNLSASSASGTVNGILVSGGTTVNVYNNLIGDLRTPSANTSTDVIRGISVTSTTASSAINVYYNTIYINGSSTGASFSTSGVYHVSSSTATTATLNLRNNSITNTSTPKGTGSTVAYRRSGTALNNYGAASNNNLFYAGNPGFYRLIYSDGFFTAQSLGTYKSLVSSRDAASLTEDLSAKFLSTSGASSVFLHMNTAIANAVESGAANIAGFTDDFDGQIRAGNAGYAGTSNFPDIGADEIFGIENVPPVITYTLLDNTVSTANRTLNNVSIIDASAINITQGTRPRIYFKRFTDANVWLDNTSSTNGWKYTESANTASPFSFTINYSLLYGGMSVTAGVIQYFIVAQDLATIANVAINSGDFNATPASVALTSAAFPVTGIINSYTIPFSGSFNVGTGEVFTSLTKADGLFASVNSAGMMGHTTINITSDLAEDGTHALDQWVETGTGNYRMTIQPDGATRRTVSGNAATGLIRFNGTDRVTVNGSNNGSGIYLDFRNTNTAGTTATAFTFVNGATNNALRYCAAAAYTNATNGVVLFSTSTVAGGNSHNTVDNCSIHAAVSSNTGITAVYSAGTPGNENVNDTISNNDLYNYRERGLDITATGSSAWTISGNSFYNGDVTGSIDYAASTALHGIRVLGGSGYEILNNYIGGNDHGATGTNAVYRSTSGTLSYDGILLSTGSAIPASYIRGNTIAAISLSATPSEANAAVFTGIATSGAGIYIGGTADGQGNTIGSAAGNSSIVVATTTISGAYTSLVTGINCISTGGIVAGNQIGGIDISNTGSAPAASYFTGIHVNNAAPPAQVNNNLIGSSTASHSIQVLPASASVDASLTGIRIGTAVNAAVEVKGNSIQNIANMSTVSSGSFTGIHNAATLGNAMIVISTDTVQFISTAANSHVGSAVYAGIVSSSASNISGNIIYNISQSSTGTNAQITGIHVTGAYADTVSNNMITNLSSASSKETVNAETAAPSASALIGILNAATGAGQIVSGNLITGLGATSGASHNTAVTGIGINAASGRIFNNRIASFTNLATGAGPVIHGLLAVNGSFDAYNNSIRISNVLNTNGVKLIGINHAAGTNWNYDHNTVRITGNATGAALRSTAFLLPVTGSFVLRNNVLVNTRTGTGSHYAVSNLASPSSAWPSAAADYNVLYSAGAGTATEWGSGAGKTFEQWKTLSGGDVHSLNKVVTFLSSVYDLQPDSITNCSVNNAGIPVTAPVVINTDINQSPRSSTTPDPGAYEFNYTGFVILPGSNAPVCANDSVSLTVDPGVALSPSFTWINPSGTLISANQNPSVSPVAGQYKVSVTDINGCTVTDSTPVSINQLPTATISSVTSICDSGTVNLNITVSGTGLISGTLSNGDVFSGTAPLIVVPVFLTATTSFSITSLSDGSCAALPEGVPDTVTVSVTSKGEWLGVTSNWSDPVNWCGGIVPAPSTDVIIPMGTAVMPVITDSVNCRNLIISAGDTLTITNTGSLNITGTLTNAGIYADNGTTRFKGSSGQQSFTGITTFNHLVSDNTSGLLLNGNIITKGNLTLLKGVLNANNFSLSVAGNWINHASAAAFTAGTGTVTFNGAAAQNLGGSFASTFNNLTITNTGNTVSLGANTNIAGNLSIFAGVFDLGPYTANRVTAGGTMMVSNNTTLKIGGTNTFPVNYGTVTLVVASTVEYAGTNQAVASQTYGNLVLSSAAGAAVKTLPAAPLSVVGNFTSTTGAGTSVAYTAASNISVYGNFTIGASTTFNGSSYTHSIGGNWVNNGTFNGNTGTIIFAGTGSSAGGTGAQNFNNLSVAASGVSFAATTITVSGNLATTGSGSFVQAAGRTLVMSGSGKTISGSGISLENLTVSGSVTAAESLTITGNLSVSGSFAATAATITLSGASKTMSGSGTRSFGVLSVTGTITTDADFSVSSGVTISGSLSATAGTATFTGTSSLSGTANLYNVTINGTSLQLSVSAVLGIANALSIVSGSLDVTTSGFNTVNFNGPGAQNINGITYSNLMLTNGNMKTATSAVTTRNHITIGTGTTFDPASFAHNIYGNWINNGSFVTGTSVIRFMAPVNSSISGSTTFYTLTINVANAATEITLQNDISATTVNMMNGVLLTGSHILTITGTRTGSGIILGNIRRTHAFVTGVAYAFESPDNSISFSSVSGVSSITVSVAKGLISDFPFGGSISRLYTVTIPSGTYNAALRLHYNNDELNGNNESSMVLWHANSSIWGSTGKTANDTALNYVEQSGLTNISGRWTLSDDANLVQWNGSVSSDWNDAANWTVLQGLGSKPPSSSDIVNLGTAVFTYQPVISSSVTVKNIVFGSAQAVTLTLGSGGALTTLGDISGAWTANARHTIQVNNQSLTANGSIILSDGVSGHAIDLNAGSGSVTTLGSLDQSGGTSISFSGAGTLNIYKNYNYTGGTFTAGTGTVVYNGSGSQLIAKLNYNNLAISKAAGLATSNDTVLVTGNLLISSGELHNYSHMVVDGNVTIGAASTFNNHQSLRVRGNWNNNGTYVATGSSIVFDGAGTQSISASTFNNLEINKPAASLATLTGDIVIKGNLTGTSGILDIHSFFFNRDVVGGTATIGDSATLIIAADNAPNKFAAYSLAPNSTVIFNGTVAQHLLLPGVVYGNLTFRNTGPKTLYTPITVHGRLLIDTGASFDAGPNTITMYGDWQDNGTFVPQTSTVLWNGANKQIRGNTTFNKVTVSGSYTILNNVTFNGLLHITSAGSLSGGPTIHTTLNGDLINSGILYTLGTTTYTGNVVQTLSLINAVTTVAITVNFNGSVSPLLNSTSAPEYGFLNINNTGGVNPSVGWTIRFGLTIGSGASFNCGSSTHNFLGYVTNNGTITSSGRLNFTPSAAATVNLGTSFSSTGAVNFGGAGALTLAGTPGSLRNVFISNSNLAGITASSGWSMSNNFTVNSNSVFHAGNYSYQVGGNLLINGILNSGASTFTLNGTGVQQVSTTSAFHNLTVNKSAGRVALSSNLPVNGIVNFVSGNIQTGSNVLMLPSSGSITGAAQNTGWVNGRLQKYMATGNTTALFETGDTLSYLPVSINFSNITTPGNLTVSTVIGDHPLIGTAMINMDKSVNRFWTFTNQGIVSSNYAAGLRFLKTDIDDGAVPPLFGAGLYNGTSWSLLSSSLPDSTSIQLSGVSTYGEVAVGEVCHAGTAIAYPDSVYCTNAGIIQVSRTGTNTGTYSSAAGISINAATGAIDLSASTPGSYTVTYTIAAGGGCNVYTTSTSIRIQASPSAAISYAGSPYCSNAGTAAVTLAGTQGGRFSSTTGLAIDSVTGLIDLASSVAGTYTVTYTIAAVPGCSAYQATTGITITALPSATISYAGSPYCSSSGIVSVTLAGTAGGAFSAPAGLSINPATGAINTATSTEGTYTVTYTVAAANGCSLFTTTASVTVNKAPAASISYTGNPFCNIAGTAAVTITGTTGGSFSSTTGLSINTGNGDINTGASVPGTYTVTYTIAAADGCAQTSTSVNVTINQSGTWTGAVSSDWNTAENWQCSSVPGAATDVTIPAGLSIYPVISTGTSAVHNITIQPDASVAVSNAVLQIGGSITNNGIFDAASGAIELNGSAAQTLPALAFSGNTVKSFTVNNNAGVILAGQLNITDVLTVSNGSLITGGHLTLKSGVAFNARVAPVTSAAATPVSGNVTVERYIPGQRRYRLMTSAVTSSTSTTLAAGQEGQSIWGNWQNGANNSTANTGTIITGGSSTDGFDQQTTNASLFTYNSVARAFTGFTSANGKNTKYTPLKAGVAYYMFIYGDRTNSIIATTPNHTILHSTGTLTTGDQTYNTQSAISIPGDSGRFTLLGNPYASPINWASLLRTDLDNSYWGWDPNLGGTGGYVTVNTSGTTVLQAPFTNVTGLNQYIQPGQGFFMRTTGPAPQLVIREQDKVANFNGNAFGTPATANTLPLLAINLQYSNGGSTVLADGVVVAFDGAFSNNPGSEDAVKLANNAEGIAIRNQAALLSIDARKMPQTSDTVFLNLSRLVRAQYSFQIFAKQLDGSGVDAYLEDRYLHTLQPLLLTDTNNISFQVNTGIPASFDANRFRIVFHSTNTTLPVLFTAVHAAEKNKDIQLTWAVAEQKDIHTYGIEKSVDGSNFYKAGETMATGSTGLQSYQWLDVHPVTGNNFYRLRAMQADGHSFLSKTVVVNMAGGLTDIRIFPNPVKNHLFYIQSGAIAKGKYTIQLYNPQGQQAAFWEIQHPGGKLSQVIYLKKMFPSGQYFLEIGSGKEKSRQPVFID